MPRRAITDLPALGFPAIPLCVRQQQRSAGPPVARHRHQDAFQIYFLASGMQIRCASGRPHLLTGQQVLVTRPGEWHSTGVHPLGKGLAYWLLLRPRAGRLLDLPPTESRALVRQLHQATGRCLPAGPRTRGAFESIFASVRPRAGARQRLAIRQALLDILIDLGTAADGWSRTAMSDRLQAVCVHVERHIGEPMSSAGLAAVAGLSLSRLRARMQTEMGVPLGEWLLRMRIDHAIGLLAQSGQNITEIALAAGFPSSQYFATVFKRFMAMTPSAYRAELETPRRSRRLRMLGSSGGAAPMAARSATRAGTSASGRSTRRP